jgi:hypothetical protein
MSNASAAAIAFASGAPMWVVIVVLLLTSEHSAMLLAIWSEDVIDVLIGCGGKKLTQRVVQLRTSRRALSQSRC